MARARNIKPGLFKNEILGVADPLYTLLFEGLWLLADREGRLENRPLRIRAEIFPYREGLDIVAMLGWLEAHGFIHCYQYGELALIQIDNFGKHQNPHKNEPNSVYPDMKSVSVDTSSEKIGSAPNAPEGVPKKSEALGLIPDSGFLIPDYSHAATAAEAAAPARQKAARKSAMPENFGVSERVKAWAQKHGFGRLDEHLESFRGKVKANGYIYASWDDAFMEAIRGDWAKLRQGRTTASKASLSQDERDVMDAKNPRPQWAKSAGFGTVWEARNEGCHEHTAHLFLDGRRIEGVTA